MLAISFCLGAVVAAGPTQAAELRVGAAAAELEADDTMPIAGGIHAWRAKGQEGKLRATAVVIESGHGTALAIVSCDVLAVTRDLGDAAVAEIVKECGIPAENVLLHATHTHHAPSTLRVHGYGRCEPFCERLKAGIVKSVREARRKLSAARFLFAMAEERTVGMNSRLLLKDGTIFWVGSREDAVRPTGPFDPDLPVFVFRSTAGSLVALLYGHSTHSIGSLRPGVRSPTFYGMVAQDLETQLGGIVAFLEGASGSTHNYNCSAQEAFSRIKQAVLAGLDRAQVQEVTKLAAIKRPFTFKVRTFDEAAEEEAVSQYCNKRIKAGAESVISVFRQMRRELAPHQGQMRQTWLQVMRIGEVAIVGVPAELFTRLGIDIKKRSPLKHTVVVELANDWIGYLPDREAHQLGGYQVWTGLHSYAEPGTGERLVEEAVAMLKKLAEP